MDNQLELYVNGVNDTIGQVTLYGDEPISLSISLTDIADISKRNSTFSQNFVIPANANNNILLNHIFNIGADSTFDPSKKTPCFMLIDSIPVFTGYFQLIKIRVDTTRVVSYECVVYGETFDIVKALGSKLITGNPNPADDLDFSELNHKYTSTNIENSWSAITQDLGYYYPLIDYGYDLSLSELNSGVLSIILYAGTVTSSTINTLTDVLQTWNVNALAGFQVEIVEGVGVGQTRTITSNTIDTLTVSVNWNINPNNTSKFHVTKLDPSNPYSSTGNGLSPLIFKPALSNPYLFKKILTNAGFSSTPGFLESEAFAETIIPYNGNFESTLTDEYIQSISFRAGLSSLSVPDPGAFSPLFTNDSTAGNYDNGNLYAMTMVSLGGGIMFPAYTPNVISSQDFVVNVKYQYNNVATFPDTIVVRFFRSGYMGGTSPFTTRTFPLGISDTNIHQLQAISLKCDDVNSTVGLTPIQAGESVYVTIDASQGAVFPGPVLHRATFFQDGTYWYNRVSPELAVGGDVLFNKFLPKNIKQIDYIKSIIAMFNLMVIPDKDNPKRLTFIPRNDYYATGTIKDWTLKVDNTEKIEETLISEQQDSIIRLTYKADKDYYNTDYTDRTKTIYGEYVEYIDNEWIDGEKKIEVIFSPTPITKVPGSTDIFLPKIAKRDAQTAVYGRTDHNIRFLRKNQALMPTVNTIQLAGKSPINFYPYAGHLDHPIYSNVDYNFGAIQYAYYNEITSITPNNLVGVYWQKYLKAISDKNSKLIKLKMYLTSTDISQFNYNDIIFIDRLTDDGGHYFVVNKITYSPTSNLPSLVELVKTEISSTNPVEAMRALGPAITDMPPIGSINLGDNAQIKSGPKIVVGRGNITGETTGIAMIVGINNVIDDNVQGTILLGSSNKIVTESNTVIVKNTKFNENGSIQSTLHDIDSGEDTVLNPFNVGQFNDIDSGKDTVLGIGGVSPVNDFNSGEDLVY